MTHSNLEFDIRPNESLAQYNSWRIGGAAKQIFFPKNIENLANFLKYFSKNHPDMIHKLFWMGLGSNLLVSDEGYDGTVIITQRGLNQITLISDAPDSVRIEAGVACGLAARFCARHGLTGIEFLAGVPGTIGGALAMNAGAHGGETWQYVVKCETINSVGNQKIRHANEYEPIYRYVARPQGEWFVAAHFKLILGDSKQSLAKIKDLLAHRAATQPINLPNCGSVFRNPPGNFAAKLIETSGLKNYRIGGAYISEKHANFIITDKMARAEDVKNLIQHIQVTVKQIHGIELIREVQFLE